ncbi:MAG: hypothetical protein QN720_02815 [Nitrososphaeraceae archaeon]|nr:hypothetical protein [Nitrososphaeraceae archaeon]MDW0331868.1 hypothetical protein [Nitrososphaeraceae archaeon]
MVILRITNVGLIYKPQFLAITLSLVIALGLLLQSLDLPSSLLAVPSSFSFMNNAFAEHGQEIVLSLNDSSFAPIAPDGKNQVKVVVNYATQEPMVVNDLVKGVMKVYSANGTLLKTSSSPTPFAASSSGKLSLITTLTDNTVDSVTANIVFTNPIRTEIVSNELPVKIDLIRGIVPTSIEEEQPPQTESAQEEQPIVTPPMVTPPIPPEDVIEQPPQTESAQEEQPIVTPPMVTPPIPPEDVIEQPPQTESAQEEQPLAPTVPLLQGAPTLSTETTTNSNIELCNDGLDNDVDTLIDFEDGDCLAITSSPTPPLEQQLASATLEVCDDTLDNDLDGKKDLEDEECSATTPIEGQVAPNGREGEEGEDNDEGEQQSNEDEEDDEDND